MKTDVLFTHDGAAQVVLTPETDGEKSMLGLLKDGSVVTIRSVGEFAKTAGGYYREFDHRPLNQSVALVIIPEMNGKSNG